MGSSRSWIWLGVIAVATVLRPSVVTVGPLLPDLQRDLGLSATSAALLTALPVACFGIGAFAGPALSRRRGLDNTLTLVIALLVVGATVRALGSTGLLFGGTIAVGAAIAVGNVLLPALVRRDFPTRVGAVTGVYTSVLAVSSSVAALLAVPLAGLTSAGWRGPLLVWAAAAAAAFLPWLGHVRRRPAPPTDTGPTLISSSLPLLRVSAVRWLTLFMGLQAVNFYVMVAWLPSVLRDEGLPASTAGAMLAIATVLGIPAGLGLSALSDRVRRPAALVVIATGFTALGWAGLLLAPIATPAGWAVLLGLGTGATFPLALALIAGSSSDASATPQLSAVVQGVGYLLAATGPFLIGLLREVSGAWPVPLGTLLLITAGQAVAGWLAGHRPTVQR